VIVDGFFFARASSRPVPARASLSDDGKLTITDQTGAILGEIAFRKVRISARLGTLRRRLELPGHGHFETDDNDGVDDLAREAGRLFRGTLLHRLESSLRLVALSVVVAALSVFLAIRYGFPAAAHWLAFKTPHPVAVALSQQTLSTMDRMVLEPSELKPEARRRALALFARVAAACPQGRAGYRLVFREGGAVGPNAFSLPDGTIVMTDELYRLAHNDDELEGVIAHADRRHVLQELYEGSLLPAAIALITGDASQFGQIATVLPALLIQQSYSRAFEQQADDDSAATMKRVGANPAALADFLDRAEKELCGTKGGCAAGWLGSHPATAERAARLRAEADAPAR